MPSFEPSSWLPDDFCQVLLRLNELPNNKEFHLFISKIYFSEDHTLCLFIVCIRLWIVIHGNAIKKKIS